MTEPEPDDAEHGDVPEDLTELHEVLEWQTAVQASSAQFLPTPATGR